MTAPHERLSAFRTDVNTGRTGRRTSTTPAHGTLQRWNGDTVLNEVPLTLDDHDPRVPIGGRTLPVLDMVFPGKQQGTPKAEKRFLTRLRTLIPTTVRPVLVTDAGFRHPWFQAVSAIGWDWVGRLRLPFPRELSLGNAQCGVRVS